MVGSVCDEGGSSHGWASSTARLQEFLDVASGSVATGISSIMESAPEYYRNIGGEGVFASVNSVLGNMSTSVSSYADTIREYALKASEEAQPHAVEKLKVLRDKFRAVVPFGVRYYIPESFRKEVDRIIRMNERKRREERYQERVRSAYGISSNPTVASSVTFSAEKHHPTAVDLECCEDFALCKGLFGGFDEEESQPIEQTAREDMSHDVTLSESHEKNASFLAGIYSHYHMGSFGNGEGESLDDNGVDFSTVYAYYYKKDIEEEDRKRENRISSEESTPSANVADVHLTAHMKSDKRQRTDGQCGKVRQK